MPAQGSSFACAAFAFGLLLGTASAARAESLRCEGGIAAEGDSRAALLYKCGQPVLLDRYCESIYLRGSPWPLPGPVADAHVACQPVDEWIYERGPGNLIATVRLRHGRVQSIRYGKTPR